MAMSKRYLLILLFVFMPVLLFSQREKQSTKKESVKVPPVGIIRSETFDIRNVAFNKTHDVKGRGEVLRVEFEIANLIDEPADLYIFVIAIHELLDKSISSFRRPIPKSEMVKNFVPFPYELSNFQDTEGKTPEKGNNALGFRELPKNPKAGKNPVTGKPYHLKDKLYVKTTHLSKYRRNYVYFNKVILLIYDEKKLTGSDTHPVYRQVFHLSGKRR
jgi:hypothetical protein